MELPRGFKGVWIPKDIWLDQNLAFNEKVIFAEIDSLDSRNGCFAKNEHFATFVGLSEKQVSRIISNLKKEGYIEITLENIKGKTRRTLKSAYAWMRMRPPTQMTATASAFERTNDPLDAEASISNTSNTDEYTALEASAGRSIPEIIKAFEQINPSYGKWYGNKTQRGAIERMLKSHGKDRLLQVVAFLPTSNTIPYVPTITSPFVLETKWADLESSLRKMKNKQIISQPNVII